MNSQTKLRWLRGVLALLAAVGLWPLTSHAQFTDTLPPQLTGLEIIPSGVDVSSGPAVVTVRLHVVDDLSGVIFQDGSLYIYSEDYSQNLYIWYWNLTRISGDDLDGIWEGTFTIPQFAQAGKWRIGNVGIPDRVGNFSWYYEQQLLDLGFNPYIDVTSVTDSTPPTVVSVSADVTTIDTSVSDQGLILTVEMTDDISGVGTYQAPQFRGVWVQLLWNPSGNEWVYRSAQLLLDSGSPLSGTWKGTVYFPRWSQQGTYSLLIYGYDEAGNYFNMGPDQLSNAGFLSEIEVTSDPSDTSKPVLASLDVTPITIDTSDSDRVITFPARVTDDMTGLWYGYAYLRSPSGAQYRYAYFSPPWPVTDPLAVDTVGTVEFPRYSEAGTWRIDGIQFYDQVGNRGYYEWADLERLGFPTAFNVILPSRDEDGAVDTEGGGVVEDDVFGERAQLMVPPGAVTEPTTVAIDVLQDPLDVPIPSGFQGELTRYVNIHLDPEPNYPLPPPGLTVVLPLVNWAPPGTVLHLYRIEPSTGLLEMSIGVDGSPVLGTVDASGLSATFVGISRLSTVVALLQQAVVTWAPPLPITYGTELSDVQLNATADMPGTFEYTPPVGKRIVAGEDQVLRVLFTPSDPVYARVEAQVTIDVKRAPLTIRAEDQSKVVGEPMPVFTLKYEGFVYGEGPDVLDTPATGAAQALDISPAGSYPIKIFGGFDSNYDIVKVDGVLKVLPPSGIGLFVYPKDLYVGTPKLTSFQMYVPPNANLLPATANLQRANGTAWSVVGTMYDDGTHGDLIAGDSTFTLELLMNEPKVLDLSFRGSIGYKGQLKRTFTAPVSITVR